MALKIDVTHSSVNDKLPSPQVRRINELFSEENIHPLLQTIPEDGHSVVRGKHSSCELTGSLDLKNALDRTKSWDSDSETTKKRDSQRKKEEIKKDESLGRPRSSSLKRLSMKLNLSKKSPMEEGVTVIPLDSKSDAPIPAAPIPPPAPIPPIPARVSAVLERTSSAPSVSTAERVPLPTVSSDTKLIYTNSSPDLGNKITAATEDQLICMLAGERAPDKDFVVHFLLTHHRFIKSKDLLQKLVNRYNLPAPEGCTAAEAEDHVKRRKIIQVRVINVIKKWIERLIMSFQQDIELLMALQKFIQTLLASGGTEAIWGSNLQVALLQAEDAQIHPATGVVSTDTAPKPVIPKTTNVSELNILDIDPLEAARQLTLIESRSFSRISPDEYKNKAWCSRDCATASPNVLDIITRFNKLSYWIASEILLQSDLSARVKLLSRFIKLGEMLRTLNNLQGVMTVTSALNMSAVQRLYDTWKALPSKYSIMFDNITALMSAVYNFKTYRDLLRNSSPPLVPFQGVYLSDLTFMEEAPDILDNDLVNFRKMMLVGDVLNDVQKFQQVKYVFLEVPCIQEFFTDKIKARTMLDDKQLHALSRKIEPKKEVAG